MMTLLSGYDKTAQTLMFRVYAQEIPPTERKQRSGMSHLCAWDLLGAALAKDFGISHARCMRSGLEKPVLVHDSLHMNLSHCQSLAVAAVGAVPLGVDAEPPRDIREKLMHTVCTRTESAFLTAQPEDDRRFSFSRLWTLKEAYTKFTGDGIRKPFSSLEFHLGETLEFCHPAAHKFLFFQLLQEKKHIVSLCVPQGEYDIVTEAEGWELIRSASGSV